MGAEISVKDFKSEKCGDAIAGIMAYIICAIIVPQQGQSSES